MNRTTWIVVGLFLLAAGVVLYVLYQTKQTLKNAQTTADKADALTKDVQGLGSGLKKAWTDFNSFVGDQSNE